MSAAPPLPHTSTFCHLPLVWVGRQPNHTWRALWRGHSYFSRAEGSPSPLRDDAFAAAVLAMAEDESEQQINEEVRRVRATRARLAAHAAPHPPPLPPPLLPFCFASPAAAHFFFAV